MVVDMGTGAVLDMLRDLDTHTCDSDNFREARAFMITVSMTANTIKVRGHAGYAPQGQDIVCAGVTALTQTLVESLETLTSNEIKYDMSPGRIDIEIMNPDEDAQLLTDSFLVGIEMIVDEFPEHIRVEISNDLGL